MEIKMNDKKLDKILSEVIDQFMGQMHDKFNDFLCDDEYTDQIMEDLFCDIADIVDEKGLRSKAQIKQAAQERIGEDAALIFDEILLHYAQKRKVFVATMDKELTRNLKEVGVKVFGLRQGKFIDEK